MWHMTRRPYIVKFIYAYTVQEEFGVFLYCTIYSYQTSFWRAKNIMHENSCVTIIVIEKHCNRKTLVSCKVIGYSWKECM